MRDPWQRWGKNHSQNSGCLVSGHLAPQGAKDVGRQDEGSRADFTDSGVLPWTGFQASVDFEEPTSAWSETLARSLRDYSVEVGFKEGQSHFKDTTLLRDVGSQPGLRTAWTARCLLLSRLSPDDCH